jgi:hypothetical protein
VIVLLKADSTTGGLPTQQEEPPVASSAAGMLVAELTGALFVTGTGRRLDRHAIAALGTSRTRWATPTPATTATDTTSTATRPHVAGVVPP